MFKIVDAQIQHQFFQNIQSYIYGSNSLKQINFCLLLKFLLTLNWLRMPWSCKIQILASWKPSEIKESQLSKDILAFPKLGAVTARRCYVVCQCSAQCSVSVWRRKVESRDVPKPAVSCGQGSRRPVSCRGSFGNRSLEEELARYDLEMRTNPLSPVRSNQPNQQKKKKQPTRRPIYRKKRHIARSRSRWPLFREYGKSVSYLGHSTKNIEGQVLSKQTPSRDKAILNCATAWW